MTKIDLDDLESKARRLDIGPGPRATIALIARIRSLQTFVDALPDDGTLQTCKLYREQAPELFTDEDGNALYMDEARRRLLAKGAVLP